MGLFSFTALICVSLFFEGSPAVAAFTVERLMETAGAERTIEGTIAALPIEMRANYVLMHRSRSLQKASVLEPRAILFAADGSLAMAFNGGDPAMAGFDRIEAVQFRETQKRWEFREIAFAADGHPVLSEANPKRCLGCHQGSRRTDVDPRPNWEPYQFWPGAYGAVDAMLGMEIPTELAARLKGTGELARLVSDQRQERNRLSRFQDVVKPLNARYRALGGFDPRSTKTLTDVLANKNDLRVGRLAAESADWDVYRGVVAEAFLCPSPPEELPSLAPDELRLPQAAAFKSLAARLPPYLLRGSNTRRIEYFFDARGIDTSDWSMDFRTGGRFAYEDRFGTPSYPTQQLLDGMSAALGGSPPDCQQVRTELTLELPRLRASGRIEQVARDVARVRPSEPAALARCTSCHSGPDGSGPALPFDDLTRLKAALRKTGYPRGSLLDEITYRVGDFTEADEQMPPEGRSSAGEGDRLVAYLRGL